MRSLYRRKGSGGAGGTGQAESRGRSEKSRRRSGSIRRGTAQGKQGHKDRIRLSGVVVLIALAAGGIFYAFAKQKQKKQAEKEALDPDANYTEDKGDFEIPMENEPEETSEENNTEV